MIYNYKCKKCGLTKQINIPVSELKVTKVTCSCGEEMTRDWKANIMISSNDKSDNIAEMSWVKESLKKRPSGKSQVFY